MFPAFIDSLGQWLQGSVLVRLFVIIALGYLLGDLRLPGNFRFGVAAVLFVGLAFGAWHPEFLLPDEIQSLGLVLFVYCVGLQAAAGFFQSMRREGLALNAAMLGALVAATFGTILLGRFLDLPPALAAGLFCGALTNTAALGAATDTAVLAGLDQAAVNQAVIGYGVAYPLGILVVLLFLQIRAAMAGPPSVLASGSDGPLPTTIEVTNSSGLTVREAGITYGIIFTRIRLPDGRGQLVTPETILSPGMLIIAVGTPIKLQAAVAGLGRESPVRLQEDLQGYELHRYFVSNKDIVGRPVRELGVESFGGVISRVRRGDIDLPVTGDTVLQLGDRVRVVSTPAREKEVRRYFGNSLTVLTETGYLSFAVGIVLGLALGNIPFPVPGLEHPVRLGVAGGGLIAALILGRLGRTGPFIWNLPYDVNLALRQLGILFFLAAVGVKAGGGLSELIASSGALRLIIGGVVLTVGAHLVLMLLLRLLGKRDAPALMGVMCGFQTQPAALTFAATRTDVAALNTAYATVYPLALVAKIILAQLLILL